MQAVAGGGGGRGGNESDDEMAGVGEASSARPVRARRPHAPRGPNIWAYPCGGPPTLAPTGLPWRRLTFPPRAQSAVGGGDGSV